MGPVTHRRRGRPGPRRDDGRRRARPTGATGFARHLRQLPVVDGVALAAARRSAHPSRRSARWSSGRWHVGSACRCGVPGAFTSSKVPDGQAMLESAVSMQSAIAVRRELHPALGRLAGGRAGDGLREVHDGRSTCAARAHTYLKGIDLSDEQFALDGFPEVGPGKHFFGSQHTLRHYETAFWDASTQRQLELRAMARRR